METKSNYQERAEFIIKKAVEKQSLLADKIQTFYTQIYKKQQQQEHKEQEKQDSTLEIDQVNHMGSLSNQVYKVTLKNGNTIIVKHYFDILKDFVQRDIQHQILNIMTKKKEYPYVFYKDHFCRVEAFIPGSSISRDKLTPKLLFNIIESLANFSIKYQNISKDKPVSNFRQISNIFQTYQDIYKTKKAQNPELVGKVAEYVDGVIGKKEILQNLQKLLKDHKMVMSHNDSNLSNILVLNFLESENPQVQLLDFEFANMNYIGYDLGNLLNEIATDYGGAYGVDETGNQHKFEIREDWQVNENQVKKVANRYFDLLEMNEKSSQEERMRQVKIGRLLSHLFWLFVGLKQIDDPNIDLNMTYYVRRRYEEFMKLYNQLTA